MPVNLSAPNPQDLHPVPGVQIGVAMAGVRKANRRDLTVVTLAEGSAVAGVFTKNRFCAAPVQICQKHLAAGTDIRALRRHVGRELDGLDWLSDAGGRMVGIGGLFPPFWAPILVPCSAFPRMLSRPT